MPIVFDVHRLQRGLQLTKEEVGGRWTPISGVTWPPTEPFTCVWDDRTAQRVRNLTAYMHSEHPFLASMGGIPEPGELVVTPSPDRRSVSINVGSAVKDKMEEQISRHGIGNACVEPDCGSVSSPGAPNISPTPPEVVVNGEAVDYAHLYDDAICICVERLCSGLVALGILFEPWKGRGWDKEVMHATNALWVTILGYQPEIIGANIGDRYVKVRMKGAKSHDEAMRLFGPIQEEIVRARTEANITPPKDCCPSGGSVAIARVEPVGEEPIEELEVVEAGMGVGGWLAVGAGAGVCWMLWKVMFGKRR